MNSRVISFLVSLFFCSSQICCAAQSSKKHKLDIQNKKTAELKKFESLKREYNTRKLKEIDSALTKASIGGFFAALSSCFEIGILLKFIRNFDKPYEKDGDNKRWLISWAIYLSGLIGLLVRHNQTHVADTKIKQVELKNENKKLRKLSSYLLKCNKPALISIITEIMFKWVFPKNSDFLKWISIVAQLPNIVSTVLSFVALEEIESIEDAQEK